MLEHVRPNGGQPPYILVARARVPKFCTKKCVNCKVTN